MEKNTYDLDGVINLGEYPGLTPRVEDIIITGRSYEEAAYTLKWLQERDIYNQVFFNSLKFKEKSRWSSGIHKATIIKSLIEGGMLLGVHFEDDEIQIDAIRTILPNHPIVHVKSNLVEMENIWHGK